MKEISSLTNRLKKNYKQRKPKLSQYNITAYRLYEKDIPEYPYIVDIYNQSAVIYEKGKNIKNDPELQQKQAETQNALKLALQDILKISASNIIFKQRSIQKGLQQYEKLGRNPNTIIIKEGPAKFYVNLKNYLDTGLFLDHRPLRHLIFKSAKAKKVLNLFSYTGSISVAAALGGAKNVTTIDMSKTYLNWAQENFELNGLPLVQHDFFQADIVSYLQDEIKDQFDIIILDPPSFSNSKRMEDDFSIQNDHEWMLNKLMQYLSKDGILYFSNNFRKFKLSEDIKEKYLVKDISKETIPFDFKDPKIHVCFKLTHK